MANQHPGLYGALAGGSLLLSTTELTMADAPPPRKDKDNLGAIAKYLGYLCIIAFLVGALGLDDPRFPDQKLSPIYWGRLFHDSIANLFRETP